MFKGKIVVIGTSMGGVAALQQLVATLPENFPAAVLIVLHVGAQSPGLLPGILARAGPLPASFPEHGDPVRAGHIYVAPADNHLIVHNGQVGVLRGPKENRHRPAIDVLFRSAARAYGNRVIGVVLTGALDDGAAGMLAIKHRGGTSIVQSPDDATCPDMPNAVLRYMEPDYIVPLSEMGSLLGQLARAASANAELSKTAKLQKETEIAEMDMDTIGDDEDRPGRPSSFACPDCHGVLWEINDGELLRYRCRVGHAYSLGSMEQAHAESLENSLWAALRALEESAALSRRMEERATGKLAAQYRDNATHKERQAEVMRNLLLENQRAPAEPNRSREDRSSLAG